MTFADYLAAHAALVAAHNDTAQVQGTKAQAAANVEAALAALADASGVLSSATADLTAKRAAEDAARLAEIDVLESLAIVGLDLRVTTDGNTLTVDCTRSTVPADGPGPGAVTVTMGGQTILDAAAIPAAKFALTFNPATGLLSVGENGENPVSEGAGTFDVTAALNFGGGSDTTGSPETYTVVAAGGGFSIAVP